MEPTPGLSVHEAAEKLLQAEQPVDDPVSDIPQSEPSEVEEPTSELSEEVEATEEVETEEVETTFEATDETQQFLTDLNDWMKDGSHYDAIRIPTKVNGVQGEATLSEILASHQIGQASEERLSTLKAERAEFEEAKNATLQQLNGQLTQAAELVSMLEKNLIGDAEQVNWQELRELDPAEYSAKRQDFLERQQQLSGARQNLQREYQQNQAQAFQETLQRESAALLENFPSWADEAVAKQEKGEIREYLLSTGFSPQEIDGATNEQGMVVSPGLIDHRAVTIAQKAMLYDRGQQKVDVAKKKVKTLPKVAKPGKPKGKVEENLEQQKKLRGRLKKTGRVEDAASLIFDRMFGGQ